MEVFVLLLISISFMLNFIYTVSTFYFARKSAMDLDETRYPMVSILKPVKGIDDEMKRNIESFYRLDYPGYEILFGVDSMSDEVTELIGKVSLRFPHVRTRIIETGHRGDINPKVHKLSVLERSAKGKLFWVSDSNIRVKPETLKSLAEEYILNGTHLVFSPIKGFGSRTFGSLMENSYISHYLSGNVLGSWTLFRKEVVVGKSMLIEKNAIRYFGGFSYFRNYLAEDQIIGETFRSSGFRISTNATWVINFNSSSTIRSFYGRMSRWAKLRFNMHRGIYFGEMLTNTTVTGALAFPVFEKTALIIYPVILLLRILMEVVTFIRVNSDEPQFYKKMAMIPVVVTVKDLVNFAVWFTPLYSNKVNWRGGSIRIGKRTLLSNSLEQLAGEGA